MIFSHRNTFIELFPYNIGEIIEIGRFFADLITVFVGGNSLTPCLGEEIRLIGLFTGGNSSTDALIGLESGSGRFVGGGGGGSGSLINETTAFGCKIIGSLFNAKLIKACRPAR